MPITSWAKGSAAALIALSLGACASYGTKGPTLETITHTQPEGMDPIAAAAFWGTRYDRDPADPAVAAAFSKALRRLENNKEALRVVQNAASRHPDHAEIQLELGKVLIANNRAHEAVRPLDTAIRNGKADDWSAYSALGVAHDMIGEHRAAQDYYDKALAIAPSDAPILNNKGLSFALQGRQDAALLTLREATAGAGGTARIRQNYALVLALGGNTSEAERLARSDLPPAVADGNVSYYRQLAARPAYWATLEGDNLELPDFGDDPETVTTAPRSRPVQSPQDVPRGRPAPSVPDVIEGQPAPGVGAFTAPSAEEEPGPATNDPLALPFGGEV